ncbi:hypothetical protein LTR56_020096 [Elasticomyces elasticus]|nr:hypothetical protein LTR56_020096 [Elasticomyces elasticus]KAK3633859.1 hypothetical protein LTR22_019934 [Elasticomyces elasticus]KAK4910967.1 hypothetical protein LTR49_020412 [Elasticomyces elasticus]KAK5761027.1 hypothetical protein LTS12_008875 [Elasticomyces elasticus]
MPPRIRAPPSVPLRFPEICTPPSYTSFVISFAKNSVNRKAIPGLGKERLDQEFQALLAKAFPHDEKAVNNYMKTVQSEEAHEIWNRIKGLQALASPAAYLNSDEVTKLTIPTLIEDRPGEKTKGSSDKWSRQTYKEFADKLVKRNREVEITKQLADDALRLAVSKMLHSGT